MRRTVRELRLVILLATIVGWPAAAPARAEEGASPLAEDIIARAIDALGGVEAAAGVQNRHVKGRMELPAMKLSAPLDIWQARPDSMLTRVEFVELGILVSGSDGQTCWENSSVQGPRILQGAERARVLREADFDGLLAWQRHYDKAEAAGSDTVSDRPAWKLVLTPKEGPVESWWFDAESGLPVKQAAKVVTNMGEIPLTAWLSDYRDVDGARVAFRTRQSLMNGLQVMVLVTEHVEQDVELPADLFALPAEIQALKEKAETAAPN